MKIPMVHVMVGVALVSVSVAAEDSSLSGFAGKYKGTINFGGVATGSATGNVKASRIKENGVIKCKSQIASGGQLVVITEKFSIRGKRLKYQFVASGGFTQQGGGSGRAKVFKNSIKMRGNVAIGGQPYALSSTVTRRNNGEKLGISTSLVGSGGALITYNFKKK